MDRKPRILVIDDDAELVQTTRSVLKSKPYDVIVAYNGQDGLQKARSENPDLVLLDVMMPGMDGFRVVEQFKADPLLAKIPVLAMTNLSESLGQAVQIKVAEYIKKPVRSKDLLEIVDRHLKKINSQK